MKSRFLIIIGIISLCSVSTITILTITGECDYTPLCENFFIMPLVFAEPAPSYQGGYDYSEWVLIGNITSVEILSDPSSDDFSNRAGFALYTLDVEKYLKNPIENSTITVLGHYQIEKTNLRYSWPSLYEIDQRVLFYIQKLEHMPGYDYIVRDRISGVIIEQLCPENTTYENGLCFYDDNPNKANPPCINRTVEDCKEYRQTFGPKSVICGSGTELVDDKVCEPTRAVLVSSVGSHVSLDPYVGGIVLLLVIVGVVSFLIHRSWNN